MLGFFPQKVETSASSDQSFPETAYPITAYVCYQTMCIINSPVKKVHNINHRRYRKKK
jgi:hypothetical protein